MARACARLGCCYEHVGAPQWHGFCCNACRHGESMHTWNCSGYGYGVLGGFQCKRPFCRFAHRSGPRDHGFCCNACKRGDMQHTPNCSGRGRAVAHYHTAEVCSAVAQAAQQRRGTNWRHSMAQGGGVSLPKSWRRGDQEPLEYALWFMHRYDLCMEADALLYWTCLSERLPTFHTERALMIHAFARGTVPLEFRQESRSLDLHERGINARKDARYEIKEVTGLDFEVQAVMLTQSRTARAILDACDSIERNNHHEFAFACHSATHRSVACCVLLAAIVYRHARIDLTTSRTQRAASELGME